MTDSATEALLAKLDRWLLVQAEYPILFLGDRKTRRQAAKLLGQHVFTLPERDVPVPVNRAMQRKQLIIVRHAVGEAKTKFSRRQQRMQADAVKQRQRYARLSAKRLEELAVRSQAERDLAQLLEEGIIDDPNLD